MHAEKLLKSWMKLLNLLEIWEVLDILVNMLRLMKLDVLLMNYNNKADHIGYTVEKERLYV